MNAPAAADHPAAAAALPQHAATPATRPARLALGLAYRGGAYAGWQSQPSGRTVQDKLERALTQFADAPVRTVCAGRTDAGVHALNQVVHVDAPVVRAPFSWVRGTNRYLPQDIAVQWCCEVAADFHARNSARGRRYRYLLRESPVRPAVDAGACGWVFRPLDAAAMREAAAHLLGEHDFSAFRAAQCQARTPVKTMHALDITFRGKPLAGYWHFDFDASAFLHHMVRNIVGCLVAVGSARQPPRWLADVLVSRRREVAAPTFPAEGLYFLGPYYDARHDVPAANSTLLWLP